MEKGRKVVVFVGTLVLIVMAWIAWVTFKSPINPEVSDVQLPQTEMSQLRHDLYDFIVDQLKKERVGSELIDLSLQMPVEEGDGKLKVPYLLSYRDGKAGVQSSVSAEAHLEREGQLWRVTKVLPHKETITYDQNVTVSGAPGKKSSDE